MNLTVNTPDELLATLDKPVLEPLGQRILDPEDLLIICAGFEERALAILKNVVFNSLSFKLLLVHYEPHIEENKTNAIREICKNKNIIINEIIYNRVHPEGFSSIINHVLYCCKGNVFIDISAMSRLLIVQLLVTIGSRPKGFVNCFIAYTEALEYTPNETDAKKKLEHSQDDPTLSIYFLSSGVFDITVIPELSSLSPAGTQTRLIAFPSFDAHQLNSLRNEIQPSRISVIEGIPPSEKNRWRIDAISKINKLDQIQNIEKIRTSTIDYRETLNKLLNLYAKYSIYERILISPTGSKMQTVAVGIFRAFIKDVQIIYPTPNTFLKPETYTIGIGSTYLLPLTAFGSPENHLNKNASS